MQFNLNTILAVMMPFLTTAVLTTASLATSTSKATIGNTDFHGCFRGGERWIDLGSSEQIYNALDTNACNNKTGEWSVGEVLDICITVEKSSNFNTDNSFHFSWTITSVPYGKDSGNISHDVCVAFARCIIELCTYGGIEHLSIDVDGGEIISADVTADPQRGPNCGGDF
ncbi:hypothetical protein VM1G_03990 [Cytospora mali]|uniref:Ecp2 effector protein domain-containing protein n=1 Tax=Cytospora mali TaxID=578113 RepID=A0A194VYM1_CYTMA|nr:hypothetical protein VM1G_03990 [Valsa mali]